MSERGPIARGAGPVLGIVAAMPETPVPRSRADERLLEDVANYGWHVAIVPPEEDSPGWAYSVGFLSTFGHPEVVVFGLPPEDAHALVNDVGDRIRNGITAEESAAIGDLLTGRICAVRGVAGRWKAALLEAATWFHGREDMPVLQILWADADGRLPGDAGFTELPAEAQPLLHRDSPEEALLERVLATFE